jgi:hypothetical protein
VLNPTDRDTQTVVRFGLPISDASLIRLDETPLDETLEVRDGALQLELPAHALRSVLFR